MINVKYLFFLEKVYFNIISLHTNWKYQKNKQNIIIYNKQTCQIFDENYAIKINWYAILCYICCLLVYFIAFTWISYCSKTLSDLKCLPLLNEYSKQQLILLSPQPPCCLLFIGGYAVYKERRGQVWKREKKILEYLTHYKKCISTCYVFCEKN